MDGFFKNLQAKLSQNKSLWIILIFSSLLLGILLISFIVFPLIQTTDEGEKATNPINSITNIANNIIEGKDEKNEESSQENDSFNIIEVWNGDCEDINGICIADVSVIKDGKEYILEDISFSKSATIIEATQTKFDSPYYLLSFPTNTCNHSYLFSDNYLSPRFTTPPGDVENKNLFWGDYYIFQNCGQSGQNISYIYGINILNTITGDIEPLVQSKTLTNQDPVIDIAYYIEDISKDTLLYKECSFDDLAEMECISKTLDLDN